MPQQMDDELLQQAQAGEESAIAALITAMMPAIRKGAAAVAAPGLDFDDAVQEGLIGLFHAVRSYRADKKVPFTAYAAACIANAQQDARKNATRGERQMFDAVCASCGKTCKVPFQPREDRPVYCSECFAKMKQN